MDSRTLIEVETTAIGPMPSAEVAHPAGDPDAVSQPAWVHEARQSLDAPGRYLAYEDAGRQVVVPLPGELTRIGRSLSAQLRFDDSTVSRRHAVIAASPEGARVLDDRSLNGVYVNGRRVESGPLNDGDEIAIGRHRIWFLDNARVGAASAAAAG